jgi:glycosyltransferase involved in cell wall biosynthesis
MTREHQLDPTLPSAEPTTPFVVVVMPAYNAALTLADTAALIPELVDKVLVVDDASSDHTVAVAEELGLEIVRHPKNLGYGGNQKTCYRTALQMGADIVVMLHPDGQYDPRLIPEMIAPLATGEADMVLGSRMMQPGGAKAGGMPWWKRVANRVLTGIENAALGASLSEAHTGYRAYSRHFLTTIPWHDNADDFVFDTQVIFQAFQHGLRVAEVPVRTSYEQSASSVSFRQSVVYGSKSLGVALGYAGRRLAGT